MDLIKKAYKTDNSGVVVLVGHEEDNECYLYAYLPYYGEILVDTPLYPKDFSTPYAETIVVQKTNQGVVMSSHRNLKQVRQHAPWRFPHNLNRFLQSQLNNEDSPLLDPKETASPYIGQLKESKFVRYKEVITSRLLNAVPGDELLTPPDLLSKILPQLGVSYANHM